MPCAPRTVGLEPPKNGDVSCACDLPTESTPSRRNMVSRRRSSSCDNARMLLDDDVDSMVVCEICDSSMSARCGRLRVGHEMQALQSTMFVRTSLRRDNTLTNSANRFETEFVLPKNTLAKLEC